MDLIKLSSVTANPTELSVGETINGHKSVMWIERYREPGEFKIEAPLSSGLMDFLPIDSFITHLNTSVVMMVENHEIDQPKDADPTIAITGRCYTCFLENRVLGDQELTNEVTDYVLASDQTWDQVVSLINDHVVDPANVNGRLFGLDVNHTCTGSATVEERILRPSTVFSAVQDILKVDDLGLKSVRPTSTEPDVFFTVYRGNDISTKVRFSWMRGDLDFVKYFYSNRKYRNRAWVMGKWVQTPFNPTSALNFDQRTMHLDASWIDERQPSYPSAVPRALIIAAMQITADAALKAQNRISITQADVSDNTNIQYRRDYKLGDLVTVDGDFGSSAVMRVVEFAETDDETGSKGHPTLAIPGET